MTTPIPEDKKAAINSAVRAGISSTLLPSMPDSIKVALSNKQNFAMSAEIIFSHALNRTIWNYRDKYEAVDILMDLIRNTATESMATQEGISHISNLVFGKEATCAVMREFLFTLQVQFFSQFAEFDSYWVDLLEKISYAITNNPTVAGTDTKLSLVPEELQVRTHSPEHMKALLLANTWLVMFILTSLWGRPLTYEELRANYRRSAAV